MKARCDATFQRGFLEESSAGWNVIEYSRSFFPLCFLRPYRYCRLHLLPVRCESHAYASSLSMDWRAALRYSLIAWLGVAYGRRIVHTWTGTLQHWSTPLLCVFVGLTAVGLCYGIWKLRGLRKSNPGGKPPLHIDAARST